MAWFPSPWALLLAFALDLVLGDPQSFPHPIRWMGRAIEVLEPGFRRISSNQIVAGACFTGVLVFGTFALSWLVLHLALLVHPWLHFGLEALCLYYCLSLRSLAAAAKDVGRSLHTEGLESAKGRLQMIVGRDVARLSETGVVRGAVETVAENFVDGVLSPLFYAVLGGAPLALAFKMINTLDSMIGYKNSIYRDFGKAAARLDDAANWIPARLSVFIISLAAGLLLGRFRSSLQAARSEGRNHSSPNAGLSEAAFAGALQVKLGGPNHYHGQLVDKPFIGELFGPPGRETITNAGRLLYLSASIALAAAFFVLLVFDLPA